MLYRVETVFVIQKLDVIEYFEYFKWDDFCSLLFI